MLKKYWIIIFTVTLLSLGFIYRYHDVALPMVHIKVTQTSEQIKQAVVGVCRQQGWDISGYQLVTKFNDQPSLQAFVELEGGGKAAFLDMIDKDYYQPFAWVVRCFKEKEIQEYSLIFTPDGKKYEFSIKLPEEQPGAALSKEQALKIVQQGIRGWNVDLSNYQLVDYQNEVRVTGRIDHTFSYQRQDVSLGLGHYRIICKVSGDAFTEIARTVKIPDEFYRRYAQMRSVNELISRMDGNLQLLLYCFVIGLFGFLFFYQRRGSFLLRATGKLSCLCAALFAFMVFNQWPLIWNAYPTNISYISFVVQSLSFSLLAIIGLSLSIGFFCMLVESMGRFTFVKHIQFFKLWIPKVGGTHAVLQQTLLGYCFAIIFLAYGLGFSWIVQSWGWWAPLQTMIDPNILSMRVPFFSPMLKAIHASFSEECLFRALPLAGILILTRHSPYKKYWFWAMFVFSIFMFGAAHANYAQQPAYHRIVELMLPSIGFGLFYYFYGLLPGMIAHFVYDGFLMSMPIFVSTMWLQKIGVIFLLLLPLLVVLFHWMKQGFVLKSVDEAAFNGACTFALPDKKDDRLLHKIGSAISSYAHYGALLFGLFGLSVWYVTQKNVFQLPPVRISHEQAKILAKKYTTKYFGELDDSWTVVSQIEDAASEAGNKFVWQKYGNAEYQKLLGSYICSPYISVSYKKFSGSVENRAEKYGVRLGVDGALLGIQHVIPEFVAGDDLSDHQAQKYAYEWIYKLYRLDKKDIELVFCKSIKHENRRDWVITLRDIKNYTLSEGQGRIVVCLSGSCLSEIYRFVHAPESWLRNEQDRLMRHDFIQFFLRLLIYGWILLFGFFACMTCGFTLRYFLYVCCAVLTFIIFKFLILANVYSRIIFYSSTSEPIVYQIVNVITSAFVKYVCFGACFSVLLWWIWLLSRHSNVKYKLFRYLRLLITGIALGTGMYGAMKLFSYMEPQLMARGPAYSSMNSVIAGFDIFSFLMLDVLALFIVVASFFYLFERVCTYFKLTSWMWQICLFCGMGIISSECFQLTAFWVWLLSGIIVGMLWYVLYRYFFSQDIDLLLVSIATMNILGLSKSIVYGAYPDIMLHGSLAIGLFLAIVFTLYRRI